MLLYRHALLPDTMDWCFELMAISVRSPCLHASTV